MILLGFPDYRAPAQRLAAALGLPYREIELHRFPDGESKITVPVGVGKHVLLCRSLDQPNDKLVELLLTVSSLREQGASRITLVAPYLCYMRQDIAFRPGEAVSQRIIGKFLADLVDDVMTVDPHLHRINTLDEAVPAANAIALSAYGPLSDHIVANWTRPLLLGPDSESEQWVSAMASRHGLDWGVARKQRLGDRSVIIELPELDFHKRQVILVDDMASTGQTLAQTARALAAHKPAAIAAVLTHALFVGDALTVLQEAGITQIASSDSIVHASNAVQLAPLLAEHIQQL